jgi:poly(3-hydroxybutyrate) depolymerase
MRKLALMIMLAGTAAGCAPAGYHYDAGSFTPTPNDVCQRPEMSSAGAISIANATVGAKTGIPRPVAAMKDFASADHAQLATLGLRFNTDARSVLCHATLLFPDGTSQGGVLSMYDPGAYAAVQLEWVSDLDIAARRASADGLRSGRTLYVKPDLVTPAIQQCVGRETALGVGEEFPGQLWAACASKRGA